MKGYIKKLVMDKGYGFIKNKELGQEWFFHRTGVVGGGKAFDELTEGIRVSFEVEDSPKGPRAVSVQRIP